MQKQNLTPHLIKDIFAEKYNHLMDCAEYQKAVIFALDTKLIVLNTLDRDESADLRKHLDNCIAIARVKKYNAKWNVNLEV